MPPALVFQCVVRRTILSVLFTPVTLATLLAGAVVLGALIVIARRKSRALRADRRRASPLD